MTFSHVVINEKGTTNKMGLIQTFKFCRTIANMDVKLDFVPPSLINFISRQLIGNGFRLFQKVVDSFRYVSFIRLSMKGGL